MAVNYGQKIAETAQGFLAYVTNELRNYAKNDDCPKDRQGSNGRSGLYGLSANLVVYDENLQPVRETEVGLEQWKLDERYRDRILAGDMTVLCSERTIHCMAPDPTGTLTDDQRMVPVLLLRHDGITPLVPFLTYAQTEHGPSLQRASVPPPTSFGGSAASRFYSDDGYYCFNVQGPGSGQPDGRIIQYRIVDENGARLADESKWVPVAEWTRSVTL